MEKISRKARLELLGKEIKARRTEQGLTQARLAYMINSGQSYIYHVESGKIGLSIESLMKIADALGTDVRDLIVF